jgi:hypothetical protein
MIKELTYNLPGYGFANCYLIGQAVDLMDMFESSDVIKNQVPWRSVTHSANGCF